MSTQAERMARVEVMREILSSIGGKAFWTGTIEGKNIRRNISAFEGFITCRISFNWCKTKWSTKENWWIKKTLWKDW